MTPSERNAMQRLINHVSKLESVGGTLYEHAAKCDRKRYESDHNPPYCPVCIAVTEWEVLTGKREPFQVD